MSRTNGGNQSLDKVRSLHGRLGTARWREEDWGMMEQVLESYERLSTTLFEV